MLLEVVAPDEPLLYAEARRWHDPAAGVVVAILPPIASRASEVLGAIVAAAGGVPLRRSPANEDQALESAVARLRAHQIHTVVAMHSQWLPDRARAPLAGAAALAALWLVLVTHEFHADGSTDPATIEAIVAGAADHYATDELEAGPGYDPEALDPWRDAHWGWAELRNSIDARSALRGVGDGALGAAMPMVGLAVPHSVSGDATGSPAAAAAYEAVVRAVRRGGAPAAMLRRALRSVADAEADQALAGAAAGLAEAGVSVVRSDVPASSRRWRDLWRIPDTAAAAAVVLRACRVSDADAARLRVDDVADDAGSVATPRGRVAVPAGAAPFLLAQRLVAGTGDSPLLLAAGRAVGPTGVDGLARDGLAALGLEPARGHRGADPAPSAAWLLERGVAVRGADLRIEAPEPTARGPRRCRHSLPDWVAAAGVQVSHSQRLCRVRDAEELAPPESAYSVADRREEDGVAILVVDSPWGRATYWRVATPLGPAWLQSRAAATPPHADVSRAVAAAQRRPGQSGEQPAGGAAG